MKVSKNDFTGTGKVYRFTLSQMLKGKANIITMLIFFLITAASIPVMTLMMGGKKEDSSNQAVPSGIQTVYIQNDTGYQLDLESIPLKDETFKDTEFADVGPSEMDPADIGAADVNPADAESADALHTSTKWSEETYESRITKEEAYVHMQRDMDEMCFTIRGYTLEDKDFTDESLDSCIDLLYGVLDEARYAGQGMTSEQMAALTGFYETNVQSVSEYLEEEDIPFNARFGVQMIYSVLLLILCSFSASFIIQKVIEEKASKLAELLMVSIRPLAMLLGKILAVMTYVFGLLAALAAVAGISYVITGQFADTSVLWKQMVSTGISSEILRISPVTALVLVISLLLGYLQVSLISGLIGTGCSSTEDVEPANLAVILLVMAGYMAAMMTAGFGNNPVLTYLVSLCPVASMFCAPARYIIGDIGIGMLGFSWIIQIIVILLLAYVCAKLYRALMMYRGSRMKLSGWIAMFRQSHAKEVEGR